MLKPGGRLYIADMVRDDTSSARGTESAADSWADCVAGTLSPDSFLHLLEQPGFADPMLVSTTGYRTSPETIGALFRARKPDAG